MKVSKADAIRAMVAIGFAAAKDYSDERLTTKINKLDQLVTDENRPRDKELRLLVKGIVKAIEAGDDIEVQAAPAAKGKVTNIAPAKGGKKTTPPPPGDDDDDEDDEDQDEEEAEDGEEDDEPEEDEEETEDEDDGGADDADEDDDSDAAGDDEDDEDLDEGDDEDDVTEDDEELEDADDTDDEDDENQDEDDSELEDEDDDVEEAPAKTKPVKKTTAAPSKNGKEAAAKPVKGMAPAKEAPGVIETTIKVLQQATSPETAMSRAEIIKKVSKICGKDVSGTVEQQVPKKLRTLKGLNVQQTDEDKFYVATGKTGGAAEAPPKKKGETVAEVVAKKKPKK